MADRITSPVRGFSDHLCWSRGNAHQLPRPAAAANVTKKADACFASRVRLVPGCLERPICWRRFLLRAVEDVQHERIAVSSE